MIFFYLTVYELLMLVRNIGEMVLVRKYGLGCTYTQILVLKSTEIKYSFCIKADVVTCQSIQF